MVSRVKRSVRTLRAAAGAGIGAGTGVLLAASLAIAATSVTKHFSGIVSVPAGQTRTVSLPYPDALEYGNARYSGRAVVLAPKPGAKGRSPSLKKVKILYAGSAFGGSSFEVRAHNSNSTGTAAVRLEVIATTLEPLPHS
jgi:hypothetical protein